MASSPVFVSNLKDVSLQSVQSSYCCEYTPLNFILKFYSKVSLLSSVLILAVAIYYVRKLGNPTLDTVLTCSKSPLSPSSARQTFLPHRAVSANAFAAALASCWKAFIDTSPAHLIITSLTFPLKCPPGGSEKEMDFSHWFRKRSIIITSSSGVSFSPLAEHS